MINRFDGFTLVTCHGIVCVNGEAANIPIIVLKDTTERTIAVPLGRLEAEIIQKVFSSKDEWHQPYQAMVSCIEKLGARLKSVCIDYSDQLDMPTRLIIEDKTGEMVEIAVATSEGIACSQIADAPIYVSNQLIKLIGSSPVLT